MTLTPPQQDRRQWLRRLVGVLFLFSGVALLMHILVGVSLRAGLLVTVTASGALLAYVWRRVDSLVRRLFLSRVRVGLIAGVIALVVYDLTKWGLSVRDPSPFDPFGATQTFGALFVGSSAPASWIVGAGVAYHVLNAVLFAIAYCLLLGDRGVLAGVGWGIFLETFQLTLYPGWLDVRFYQEFVQITFLAHVAYGATLGYVCKRGLSRPTLPVLTVFRGRGEP